MRRRLQSGRRVPCRMSTLDLGNNGTGAEGARSLAQQKCSARALVRWEIINKLLVFCLHLARSTSGREQHVCCLQHRTSEAGSEANATRKRSRD